MRDFVHDIPGGHYFPFRIQPIGSADPTVVGNGMDMPGLWGFVEIEGA